ncbi:MAG: hypothetical protein MRERV_18c017 [Mycoplasmataceae bacterium RV_VA103A]|nr:MAG: hypothetical protein MRERV_18c017 [Mycoplasmataceae bacterium RV_VA103A]
MIWEAAAWTNSKTEQGFTIFVPKKYLERRLGKGFFFCSL